MYYPYYYLCMYIYKYTYKKIEFEILYLGMSFKLFEWYYITYTTTS